MTRFKFAATLIAALALMISGSPAWSADPPAPAAAPAKKTLPKDLVLKNDGRCTECHDENDAPEQLAIGKTRHGATADKRAPTCETCHGKSDEHVTKAGRGKEKAPGVEVGYTKGSRTPIDERNRACLACHQGAKRIGWQSSLHATRDVACTSCHKIHTQKDAVRDVQTQSEVCYTCHKEQRAQMSRQSRHPVPEARMSCASCHNVHSDTPKALVKNSTNETCYTCHMEKRGPFVHNHQPVSEDCGICHNPHGTNVPNLLKARSPYLCQECHSHINHPGQLAGLPTTGNQASISSLGAVARGCMNCHTNIHGGNSTVNSATAGRYGR